MDVEVFRKVLEEGPFRYHYSRYSKYWRKLVAAAAPEHVSKWFSSGGFSDQIKCSCGWESPGYWDMAESACDDWLEHVADAMGLIPKTCPCGKKYVPADGEKPCHELTPLSPSGV